MLQNKLLLTFDAVSTLEANLRRKNECSSGKSIPAASHVSKQGLSVDVPRLAFDGEEEKLDDMLQRVNSRIEKLIDSVPFSTDSTPNSPLLKPDASEFGLPLPPAFGRPSLDDQMAQCFEHSQIPCEHSTPTPGGNVRRFLFDGCECSAPCCMPPSPDKANQLAKQIEERMSELQMLLECGRVSAEPKSDSEPDPENSPAPTTHAEPRPETSATHFQCEMLKVENADLQKENESLKEQLALAKEQKTVAQVENAHLQRENESLKEQLAVVEATKIVAEVAIQTISTSETCQEWAQAPTTLLMSSSERKNASRGGSPSATRSTIPRTNARVRSQAAGPELTSTQDSQPATSTPPQDKQSLTIPSSVPSSPRVSCESSSLNLTVKALVKALDAPNASSIGSAVRSQAEPTVNAHPVAFNFEEYVQYHKEPIESGWREFYQPKSLHNLTMLSARCFQRMQSITSDAWHSAPLSARHSI